MQQQSSAIFDFIVDSLRISNSPFNIIDSELIMAQCQVAVPRTFFTPTRIETQNLQMVCNPEYLGKYPGSELVIKGSYRLQWFIDGIRERGLITAGTFTYDLDPRRTQREIIGILNENEHLLPRFFFEQPTLSYHPELLVNFRVSFETDEKKEELYSLEIDLVNGEIGSNLQTILTGKKLHPTPPKKNLEKRRIPYREGYESLFNHLKWQLQNHDSSWVKSAQNRWKEEVQYLESFYHGNLDDDEDQKEAEASFYRRLAEGYRKFQPMIKIHIVNVGLFYLPVVHYTLESYEGKALPSLIYDPLRHKVIQASIQIPEMIKNR
ncbi:MAG TPA: hypothetical protein DDW50_10995 [Firmicutes bacterium]|nr:hypothetical protein [Bacillota bacterium]